MLAAITLTDLEQRLIPNKILLAGAILCLAIAVPTDPGGLPERAIAAAAAGGCCSPSSSPTRRGMGLGDVKLVADDGPLPRPRRRPGDPDRAARRQSSSAWR